MLQGATLVLGLTAFNALFRLPTVVDHPFIFAAILPIVALAGAIGGATYYATDGWRALGGWRKTLANTASLLAYALFAFGALLVALAMG